MALDQKIIDLYDEYTHAPLPRRVFLDRLATMAGSMAAALALLPLLENNYALAATVPESEPKLANSRVTFKGATGDVKAYMSRLRMGGRMPGLVIIHENRGLNPHIEDVARRAGLAGFLALAVDFLSPLGGTPSDADQARDMFAKLDRAQTIANGVAAATFVKNHFESTQKVGVMGFCWGGGMVNQVAVHSPDVMAAVPFYGQLPEPADVPKIKAKMMLQYAGMDERINAGLPGFEAAAKAANVKYTLHVYDGAQHAFHNDTAGDRYNEKAATLAWSRSIAFLKETMT